MVRKPTLWVCAALVAALLISPSSASANDAGENIVNFSESHGCEPHVRGTMRPFVGVSGAMPVSTQIRGPWGSMYGRTYYQVQQSIRDWRLPGSTRIIRAHERMLPALERAGQALAAHQAQGKSYYIYSAGSWVWRTVGGTVQPSTHAFGTSFDFNPGQNPYSRDNVLRTDFPEWLVRSFSDAGFCWGGDWVDVKDAMHFSWSGPVVTPGVERLAPYPPVTGATGFRGASIAHTSSVGSKEGSSITIADMTGEGAPDIVRLESTGRLEAAGAVGNYRTVAVRATTGTGAAGALIGDYDLDGRMDVWVPDRSGPEVRFDVWTWASDYTASITVATKVPSTASTLMLGHFDNDFRPDVYAVNGSTIDIYASVTGYSSVVAGIPRPGASGDSLVTGDHDVDGRSDVYAVSSGSSPNVRVSLATGGSVSMNPDVSIPAGASVGIGDYDGDGRDDLFVVSGSSVVIALGGWSAGAPDAWFQRATSLPVDAGPECTGASCDTIGFVDVGGLWTQADRPRSEADLTEFFYGNPNDVPFMGDWNCDGVDTPGLYRRSDGFVYLRNSNTEGIADLEFFFGNPSDVPLVGDFNGDGCDTVSIFRPTEQRIYVINALGSGNEGLGEADDFFDFGDFGDIPFAGDFDGDGDTEIGLHRPSAGQIYLKWDLGPGPADVSFAFGERGDIPVAGDWNGDGVDTIAVYRESTGNWYIRLTNSAGGADHVIHLHSHDGFSLPIVGRVLP